MQTYATQFVSLTQPDSFAAEQYQSLRLKIERLRQTRDIRVIGVTSAGANEGKTVTSINLAGALARGSGSRVLLIDADLRRPKVAEHLHVPDVTGFADLVSTDGVPLQHAINSLPAHNIDVIPAGTAAGVTHEMFRSPRLQRVLSELRKWYDYVVLDTPPVVPVVDSALLGRVVDGTLLVVSANRTPRRLLEAALNEIDDTKVLGIVFNNDKGLMAGYDRHTRRYFARRH